MKIQHQTSGQVIDVHDEHAEMLKKQGWLDVSEHVKIKVAEPVVAEPDIKSGFFKRGRPRKV